MTWQDWARERFEHWLSEGLARADVVIAVEPDGSRTLVRGRQLCELLTVSEPDDSKVMFMHVLVQPPPPELEAPVTELGLLAFACDTFNLTNRPGCDLDVPDSLG